MDGWILFIYIVGLGGRCAVECILHTKVKTHTGKTFSFSVAMGLENILRQKMSEEKTFLSVWLHLSARNTANS